ncbi:MAG: hypothetical protein R2793_02675 [Flavobacteriaceae bacterium]
MQKQVFFLYFFLIFFNLNAQNTTEISIDSMLVHIDKSTFTTGILYDRVTPWSRLDIFNDSINVATVSAFEQSLLELYRASNDQKLMSHAAFREHYTDEKFQNVVDIGILNVLFNEVNYNETNENDGSLRVVDSVFEKLNNSQPPFKKSHLFMASPLKKYAVGDTIVFRFSQDLVLEDALGATITNLTANFDTGQNYTIIENGAITTSNIPIIYSEEGNQTLTFQAIFGDGSSLTTQGVFNTRLPATTTQGYIIENYFIDATIPFQGYDESASYRSRLDYRVFYHTNNGNTEKILVKPIVIIDGFDPGDKRKIQDSDPHPDLSNEEHRSIEDMMMYFDNQGTQKNLIQELNVLGFDIVIVNHPKHHTAVNGYRNIDGGADYIERNALGHVALYQRLNTILAQNNSNHQLVIVGPSMGGQISRYALAYMEKHNIPHNTRLWVSVDSPHLGANIPVGAQTLLNTINNKLNSASAQDFVENQLGSPAAKQQLIEQYKNSNNTNILGNYLNGRTVSQGFNENRGHPFFVQYYNNLFTNGLANSLGYPQNLRKIAVVNGSLLNNTKFHNPFLAGGVNYAQTPYLDNFASSGGQTLKIKGFEDVFQTHLITLETYNMPSYGGNHKIAYLKKRKFLGFDYYDRFVTNNNSRGNMDNVPGGWFPTQRNYYSVVNFLHAKVSLKMNVCIDDWDIHKLEHVSSFYPYH